VFVILVSFSPVSKAQNVPDSLFAQDIYNACPSCIDLGTQSLLPDAYTLDTMILNISNGINYECALDYHGLELFSNLKRLKIILNSHMIGAYNYNMNFTLNVPHLYFPAGLEHLEITQFISTEIGNLIDLQQLPNGLKSLKVTNSIINVDSFPVTLKSLSLFDVRYTFDNYPTQLTDFKFQWAVDNNNSAITLPSTVERLFISDATSWDFLSSGGTPQDTLIANNSNLRYLEYQGVDVVHSSHLVNLLDFPLLDSLVVMTNDSSFLNQISPNLKYLYINDLSDRHHFSFLDNLPSTLTKLVIDFGLHHISNLPILPTNLVEIDIRLNAYDTLTISAPLPDSLKYLTILHPLPICFPTLPQGLQTLCANFISNSGGLNLCIPNEPAQLLVYNGVNSIYGQLISNPPICNNTLANCYSYQSPLVSGRVFLDLNTNGQFDGMDIQLSNTIQKENIPSGNVSYIPNYTNYFHDFIDTNATYQYSVLNIPPNYTTPLPINITTNNTNNQDYTADFICSPAFAFDDIEISYANSYTNQAGYSSNCYLQIRNRGTNVTSGQLIGTLNNLFGNINGIGATVNNNEISWNYTLNPGQSLMYTFYAQVNQNAQIGDTLHIDYHATVNGIDYDTTNNYFTLTKQVVSSYDPNDIAVNKTIISSNEVQQGVDLTYTIRFQNTGNAPAINIFITDSLSYFLEPAYFEILYSSHPNYHIQIINTYDINKPYVLKIIYNDIMLPDSGSNSEESNGMFIFKIKVKSDALMGTIIPASANIYFDFNAPVITNVVNTIVLDPTKTKNQTNLFFTSSIAPNPVNDFILININNLIYDEIGIIILDHTGKEIIFKNLKLNKGQNSQYINTNYLVNGMYFIKITSPERKLLEVFKVVKL
jgi:hypothetical protein